MLDLPGLFEILQQNWSLVLTLGYGALELTGIAAAVHAVMHVRTAQGAVAWLIALVAMPLVALPFYAAFGNRRFAGYVDARRAGDKAIEQLTGGFEMLRRDETSTDLRLQPFETLGGTPFSSSNLATLLVDGAATFEAIFAAMDQAERYVLVQFYIVRDDGLGEALKARLKACAARGVDCYLLYDAVGSYALSTGYVLELEQAGVRVASFTGATSRVRRLQINFRNHRKIVVVDGQTTFVGGHNVGDEYLGHDPQLSPWRDVHVQVQGPVATATQVPFAQDWYWAKGETLPLDWQPRPGPGAQTALSLPSGPADAMESCALMFVHAINAARDRLWIVSPYFVPNGSVIDALKLAVLRGVDVRLLLPANADSMLVQLAGHAYTPELISCGVRVYRFEEGFLHQKVMLVDNDLALIGTANMDNRSFRLNFEITLLISDREFAQSVTAMLNADFQGAREIDATRIAARGWWFKASTRGARLLSPIL